MKPLSSIYFSKIDIVIFDFDGVFTNNKVLVSEDGVESVVCSRLDGIGLQKLRDLSIPCIIMSTETNKVVQERADKLKIACMQAVEDKEIALKAYCSEKNYALENVVFLGNDINDLCALNIVGKPIVVNDCHEDLNDINFFQTQKNGGDGAVREVCDKIYQDIFAKAK